MFCAIWYHLYNLKNVKNTYGGVLLFVTILHGCFSRFLNCTNGTKSPNASHIFLKPIATAFPDCMLLSCHVRVSE